MAQARAIMYDIKSSRGGYYPQGANRKGSEAGKGKGKGHGKNQDSRGRAIGQSSNTSMSRAGMRLHKPTPPSARPCLKCGSRDHEADKCPEESRTQKLYGTGLEFPQRGAWVPMKRIVTSVEAFSCENLALGKVLIDCGATDTVGSVEAIEAIIDKSQQAFGNDHDWVSVDVKDRPVYKFGDANRQQALSKVKVKVSPGGYVGHLNVHAQETEGVPVLLSAKSLTALGAVINFETGQAIFRNLEPETCGTVRPKSNRTPLDGSV